MGGSESIPNINEQEWDSTLPYKPHPDLSSIALRTYALMAPWEDEKKQKKQKTDAEQNDHDSAMACEDRPGRQAHVKLPPDRKRPETGPVVESKVGASIAARNNPPDAVSKLVQKEDSVEQLRMATWAKSIKPLLQSLEDHSVHELVHKNESPKSRKAVQATVQVADKLRWWILILAGVFQRSNRLNGAVRIGICELNPVQVLQDLSTLIQNKKSEPKSSAPVLQRFILLRTAVKLFCYCYQYHLVWWLSRNADPAPKSQPSQALKDDESADDTILSQELQEVEKDIKRAQMNREEVSSTLNYLSIVLGRTHRIDQTVVSAICQLPSPLLGAVVKNNDQAENFKAFLASVPVPIPAQIPNQRPVPTPRRSNVCVALVEMQDVCLDDAERVLGFKGRLDRWETLKSYPRDAPGLSRDVTDFVMVFRSGTRDDGLLPKYTKAELMHCATFGVVCPSKRHSHVQLNTDNSATLLMETRALMNLTTCGTQYFEGLQFLRRRGEVLAKRRVNHTNEYEIVMIKNEGARTDSQSTTRLRLAVTCRFACTSQTDQRLFE